MWTAASPGPERVPGLVALAGRAPSRNELADRLRAFGADEPLVQARVEEREPVRPRQSPRFPRHGLPPFAHWFGTMNTMTSYRARVHKGRLLLDVPTELPEGTEVDLFAADVDTLAEMTEDERRELAAEIAAAQADAEAGRGVDIEDLLEQLGKS